MQNTLPPSPATPPHSTCNCFPHPPSAPSPNGEGQWKKNLFELGREAPLQFHTTQQGSRTALTIDRGALQSGMYFLTFTSKEKREVVKVIAE